MLVFVAPGSRASREPALSPAVFDDEDASGHTCFAKELSDETQRVRIRDYEAGCSLSRLI